MIVDRVELTLRAALSFVYSTISAVVWLVGELVVVLIYTVYLFLFKESLDVYKKTSSFLPFFFFLIAIMSFACLLLCKCFLLHIPPNSLSSTRQAVGRPWSVQTEFFLEITQFLPFAGRKTESQLMEAPVPGSKSEGGTAFNKTAREFDAGVGSEGTW